MEQVQKEAGFRYIVRVVNTDLDGNKNIASALRKIKGVDFSFANAVCALSSVDRSKKTGLLTDEEVRRLDLNIRDAVNLMPSWMLNRRRDVEDGSDKHLLGADLSYAADNDIKFMKKIRTYRGVRHGMGLPVRGQRTRSNFRRNKGKVLGVVKKKVRKAG
ncbi:30S ribosomal protein S13 [Candidatus Woesearchaeota archaeon]|nr:30S ribosomal protein S13 [Candidatus Woesearchaeota archaeon]